jgi:hypothetical protein
LFTANASLVAGIIGELVSGKFQILRDAIVEMIQEG